MSPRETEVAEPWSLRVVHKPTLSVSVRKGAFHVENTQVSTASRGRGCFGGRPHGALGQPAISFRDYLQDTSRGCFSVVCVVHAPELVRRGRAHVPEEPCHGFCGRQTPAHIRPHPRSETPENAGKGGVPQLSSPLWRERRGVTPRSRSGDPSSVPHTCSLRPTAAQLWKAFPGCPGLQKRLEGPAGDHSPTGRPSSCRRLVL